MNKELLHNKNCLITGATGGVGKELAEIFAKNSCNLILTGRNIKKLKMLKMNLQSRYKNLSIFIEPCDLSDLKKISEFIRKCRKSVITVDILVNCAGIYLKKPIHKTTIQEFELCFNINTRAPFILSKEFSKDMIKRHWGRIINIGSSSSYSGFRNSSAYCTSKHAILGFSRSLYDELKEKNVRVFSISPGSIKTGMGKLDKSQDYATFLDPKEVAKFIVDTISYDAELISEEVRLNRVILK